MNAILQRAANRQGGLAAAAAARNAPGETSTPQNNDYHKNSFKCSKCHRVRWLCSFSTSRFLWLMYIKQLNQQLLEF